MAMKMHVILLNVHLNNFTTGITRDRMNTFICGISYWTIKYAISIFWYPYNMILTMPNNV